MYLSIMIKKIAFVFTVALLTACTNLNKPLPEFSGTLASGETVSQNDFKGKVLVINIWATWCGPCQWEIPLLNQLVEKYKNDPNVEFLAITDEPETKVLPFLSRKPFHYKQLINASSAKSALHPELVKSIPLHMIIDPNGKVIYEEIGTSQEIANILSDQIEKAKNVKR